MQEMINFLLCSGNILHSLNTTFLHAAYRVIVVDRIPGDLTGAEIKATIGVSYLRPG